MLSDILQSSASLTPVGTCVACFPFTGETDDDLHFTEGAVITITEFVDDDWLRGCVHGKSGMFPKAFVDIQEGKLPLYKSLLL